MNRVGAANRNIGMDIARILAMCGVLFSHTTVYKIAELDPPPYPLENLSGYVSVFVFFVLSGYLFGAGFFKKPEEFSVPRHFLKRMLRILPVYYLALFFTWYMNGWEGRIPIRCFFLLQNYKPKALSFMPVAWSLCVEEWTYVILALVFLLLGLNKKLSKDRRMIIAALLLIIASHVVRLIIVIRDPSVAFDEGIRKQTFASMDSFGYGILAAALEKKKPELFRKFFYGPKTLLFFAGCFALAAFGFYWIITGQSNGPLTKIFGFTLYAFAALFLVLFLKGCFEKVKVPAIPATVVGFCSALTYPLYLIHFQYYIKWSNFCRYQGIVIRGEYIARAILSALLWALIVHVVLEIPLGILRKKVGKSG